MKKYMVLLILCSLFSNAIAAQGIQFFEGTWEEALQEARKQDKIIFMDAYAEWCGPCKRMAREVFTDMTVGAYFNRHFINVKMDMEKGEGIKLSREYGVRAYPTLLFIDYDGTLVKRSVGAKQRQGLIRLGTEALSGIDRTARYEKAYEEDKRDPELIYNYVRALNQAGESSLKVANDYLREQEDLSRPENLRIIYAAATEADSRNFKLLIQYRKQMEELYSAEEVAQRIEQACQSTLQKAVEFSSEMLLAEAIDKMQQYVPDRAMVFSYRAEVDYAHATDQSERLEKALKRFSRKAMDQDDPESLHSLVNSIARKRQQEPNIVERLEPIAESAAERGQRPDFFLTHAQLLYAMSKNKQAIKTAEEALELARAQGDDYSEQQAVALLERIR